MLNLRLVEKVLTEEDRDGARRLRERWKTEQDARGFTQDVAADAMDISQGMVSQYLNEHTPLGVVATLRFAKFLGCRPIDIRPDFEHLFAVELDSESFELAWIWQNLPAEDPLKQYVRNVLVNYPRKAKKSG